MGVVANDEVTQRRLTVVLARHGMEALHVTAEPEELVEACLEAPPDALVAAFEMGTLDNSNGVRILRSELPETPIVVVSATTGRRSIRKALRAGAEGYVYEADIETTLSVALWAVAAGQLCVPRELRTNIDPPAFSYREKQVLELVARGFTNAEIAQHLYLAESTVKSHLSTSFRKLGVRSRTEAAAIVLEPENRIELGLFTAPTGEGEDILRGLVPEPELARPTST